MARNYVVEVHPFDRPALWICRLSYSWNLNIPCGHDVIPYLSISGLCFALTSQADIVLKLAVVTFFLPYPRRLHLDPVPRTVNHGTDRDMITPRTFATYLTTAFLSLNGFAYQCGRTYWLQSCCYNTAFNSCNTITTIIDRCFTWTKTKIPWNFDRE